MTNLAAAILCAQLERAEEIVRERNRVVERYHGHLKKDYGFCPKAPWAVASPWMHCILVPNDRDGLMRKLASLGVETRPFFIPLHTLPPYREDAKARGTDLFHTGTLSSMGMCLPTYSMLTNGEVDEISHFVTSLAAKLSDT
jgi:perosamine synthetase